MRDLKSSCIVNVCESSKIPKILKALGGHEERLGPRKGIPHYGRSALPTLKALRYLDPVGQHMTGWAV